MILKHKHRMIVSHSEITTWKTCRMKWMWQYYEKLRPVQQNKPITIGSLGHVGIAALLENKNWMSAIATAAESYKRPDMFEDEIMAVDKMASDVQTMVGMYVKTYAQNDKFKLVGSEIPFEIPIAGVKHKCIGYFDAMVEDSQGNKWLMEHKFPSQQFRSWEDTELSTQLGIYQWAAMRIGTPVMGIIYNQILAKTPQMPKLLKNGQAMSRAEIYCDWDMYKRCLESNGFNPAEYAEEMIPKLYSKKFCERYTILRNYDQVRMYAEELATVAYTLVSGHKHIYMCDNPIHCRSCQFRELCMEKVRGRDPEHMIEAAYYRQDSVDYKPGDTLVDSI